MEKFWKTVAISSIVVLILVAGIGIVTAQDDGSTTPPEQEAETTDPGGWFGHGRGMMDLWEDGPESLPQGMPHHDRGRGMLGDRMFGSSSSLLDIVAEQLGLTVVEVKDELSAGISIADLAANHDMDVQLIVDAFLAAHQENLAAAVENGRITQEQADTMQEHMAQEIAERVNEAWTGSYGPDSMRPMPLGGRGMFSSASSLLDIVAEQLNLSLDEVKDELSAGISIADLAANHNVDVQLIVDAYLAAHQESVAAAVEDGRITQEQADTMQEHMTEEIAERVIEPWTGMIGPGAGFRRGCPGGAMGGRWNDGDSDNSAAPMRGLLDSSSL